MNKKILLSMLVLTTIVGIGFATAGQVKAQMNQTGLSPMVKNLATRFNLNQTDVETFMNEQRDIRHEEMQTSREDRLTTAVNDGKITEAQKALITNKFAEKESEREQNREDMQKWADDNGIDLQSLQLGKGGHKAHDGQKGFGMHMNSEVED